MKKIRFTALACLMLNTPAFFAQQNKFNIGITGGPDLSFLSGYHPFTGFKNKPITYFSTGIYLEYNLPKTISFLTGILYEGKGTEIAGITTYNNEASDYKEKYRLNYLTVPLLVRASFGKTVRFFANAGGYFSYLQHAQINVITPVRLNYYSSNADYEYSRYDAGLALGLGCSVPVGKRLLLSLESRYSKGLMNLNADWLVKSNAPVKTNSASLLLSMAYKLGKRS